MADSAPRGPRPAPDDAKVGDDVWFWVEDVTFNPPRLVPRPATLWEPSPLVPGLWTLSVLFAPFSLMDQGNVGFSEVPANGCWTKPGVS